MKRRKIDSPNDCNGSIIEVKENGDLFRPVSGNGSGSGLPYAPSDWPKRGDNWGWKVGKRVGARGFYVDRYLYPPKCFQSTKSQRCGFASKPAIEQFIRQNFPDADVKSFWASFSWRIPANESFMQKEDEESNPLAIVPLKQISVLDPDLEPEVVVGCKAGNKMCRSSMVADEQSSRSATMTCDVCCSEPGFCRDCCCILCCRTVSSANGGYNFIKCESKIFQGYICGHVAHMDCSLRSFMAGTVGGSIGLDADYYCRRCDTRTDLVPHVVKLLRTCKSIKSRREIKKILNVGLRILRGSQRAVAHLLLTRIEEAIEKIKRGVRLDDIWNVESITIGITGGAAEGENGALEVSIQQENSNLGTIPKQEATITPDYETEYVKLRTEIDQVLQALKKSQEAEYKIAEETLNAQKNYLLNLYQQLDKEQLELAKRTPSTDPDALSVVLNRRAQIRRELLKLADMEKVANGFGNIPKRILKDHFGLEIRD